ncbi:MAG: hypothetical protein ACRDD0_02130, partial [Bacteroidales bacterium]
EFMSFIDQAEVDFIHFKTQLLLKDAGNDPIKKASIANDILNSISIIPEALTQNIYLRETSKLLNIEEKALANSLGKLNIKRRETEFQKNKLPNTYTQNTISRGGIHTTNNPPLSDSQAPFPLPEEVPPPYSEYDIPPPELVNYSTQTTSPFEENERCIIRLIVRYGNEGIRIPIDNDEYWETTVANFILYMVDEENIIFENTLYNQILEEIRPIINNPDFVAQKYFLQHSNPSISLLAANLTAERHILSKYHSKKQVVETESDCLETLAQRALLELQDVRMTDTMSKLMKQLACVSDATVMAEIMTEMREIQIYQREINKRLGERILIRKPL